MFYFGAVWLYLGGWTASASSGQPDRFYWFAILVRVAGELYLAGMVVRDVLQPWRDPVRADGRDRRPRRAELRLIGPRSAAGRACREPVGRRVGDGACAHSRPSRSQAGTLAVTDVPDPVPGPGDLLVDGIAVGVCGTDKEIAHGDYGWAPAGHERLVLGHESLGRVRQAPEGSGLLGG